ncbi:MAG: DUF3857 domain-containing protein [Bacteroidetes bacterium]|nr:MAG: DUF3857 domain-containing protein [Bacteroidota bacterium]
MPFCMKHLSLLLLLWLATEPLWAQRGEFALFGKVSPDEIRMDTYPAEPDADAVILVDHGVISFDLISRSPRVSYVYTRRIKILTEAGAEAFQTLEVDLEPGVETVTDLMGATYSLNPEGEVVQFKVDRRNIREQRRRDGGRSFFLDMPFVREGSVIELYYQLRTKSFQELRSWKFQQSIPVAQSELHVFIPSVFTYRVLLRGDTDNMVYTTEDFQSRAMNRAAREDWQFQRQDRTIAATDMMFAALSRGKYEIYVMQGLPAWKEEAFSPDAGGYVPQVSFQLAQNMLSGTTSPDIFDTWGELNKRMQRRSRQRRLRLRPAALAQVVREAGVQPATRQNQRAQVSRLYRHLRETYAWDSTYSLDFRNLRGLLDSRRGSGSERNLLLLHALRQVGVVAYPVLISTLDHGRIQLVYPELEQFNHLIVQARVEGTDMLLDLTGEVDRPGILPRNDLTELGYLIDSEGGRWVQLRSRNPIVRYAYSRFDLDTAGRLSGGISVTNQAYGAVLERARLARFDDQQGYLKDRVLAGMNQFEISNSEIEASDTTDAPLVVKLDMETRDFVRVAGDYMIVNPMMAYGIRENPLPDDRRTTPLDLTYPLRDAHMLGLRIPANYQVAQVPEPIRVVLPDDGGSFTYNVLQMDNIIHFTSTLYLNKTIYSPEEYQDIRTFFDYVVRKHQEDIVLKRVN